MRRLSVAALAAAVVSVFVVAASPSVARAAEPCWQRVLDDWTKDGKIDGRYSTHCLRQAIKHTPEDLRDYSSIDDDIQAALLGHFGASATTNGLNNGGGSGTGGAGGTDGKPLTPAEAQHQAELAVPRAGSAQSVPDSSRPLPLPLLILASVALAAILAAASPPLIQRLRTRFPRTRGAPQTDR